MVRKSEEEGGKGSVNVKEAEKEKDEMLQKVIAQQAANERRKKTTS